MRIYTIHEGPPEADGAPRLAAIKEGFCWPALLLTVLWALWHRLWLVAVLFLGAEAALSGLLALAGADALATAAFNGAVAAAVGLLANDLRRWTLTRRGYEEAAIVAAPDAEAALHRYLAAKNETGSSAPAPSVVPASAPWGAPSAEGRAHDRDRFLLPPPRPEPLVQP
jgi:hypothetical protein